MLTPQRSVAGLSCIHEVVRNSWKKYNGWADGCNQSNLHPEDLDADGTQTMGTIVGSYKIAYGHQSSCL
ncbi:unnamed protein product [Orchesella dallaii]|uniref:Uncharacterized protein n=1 Tax=Orchesella dallaii TaxID=48710 RepID=A0ABP1PQW3_9HEXA